MARFRDRTPASSLLLAFGFRVAWGIALGSTAFAGSPAALAQTALAQTALAQAVPSDQQIRALSEALRQVADEGPGLGTGAFYTNWQIEGSRIPYWSQGCLGRSLTPLELITHPETAETVVLCQLRNQLTQQYRTSNNNEAIAIKRVVAWWRTGDASRYTNGPMAPFTETVLGLYRQHLSAGSPEPNPPASLDSTPSAASPRLTAYDRYMGEGYRALRAADGTQALVNFQRALDERPNDPFATRALRDTMGRSQTIDLSGLAEPEPADSRYWQAIATNAAGDRLLVAPDSIQAVGDNRGYWEYRAFKGSNPVFWPVSTDRPVRGVLVYRLVDCAAGTSKVRRVQAQTDGHEEILKQDLGWGTVMETPQPGSSAARGIAFVCDRTLAQPQPMLPVRPTPEERGAG